MNHSPNLAEIMTITRRWLGLPPGAPVQTSATNVPDPHATAEQLLRVVDEAMSAPRYVGHLMGMPVYVDGRLPDRMVELRSPDGSIFLRFRADHPYLDGTKLAEIARR